MITKGQRVAAAAAVTTVIEPALLMAHTGGLGFIVGAGLGIATYAFADDLERMVRGEDANTPLLASKNSNGKPSIIYRALNGKSMRGECEECVEETAPQANLTRAQVEDVQRTTERLPMPAAPEMKVSRGKLADVEDDVIPLPRSAQQGKFLFSEVLHSFTPTMDRIFIGRTTDGKNVFCAAKDLCHVAIAGNTGGGKCLEENEPVFLADGSVVAAKSLVGKMTQVIGVTDTQTMQPVPVPASFTDNGIRTVIEIELDNGVVIKRTEEHPLWAAQLNHRQHVGIYYVPADGRRRSAPRTRAINAGWVMAKDLRACGNRPNFDGHVLLCPTTLHQQGTVTRPDADVILCAAILAEGCVTKPGKVGFTNADAPMVALVSQAAAYYGCELVPNSTRSSDDCQYRIRRKKFVPRAGYKFCAGCGIEKLLEEFYAHQCGFGGRSGRCKVCDTPKQKQLLKGKTGPNPIAELVKDWEMLGHATTKKIPSWVFHLPDEQIATFLRVFVDCDGWFDKSEGVGSRHPAVNVSLANPVLVRQIGQLALRLGITGTYRHKANGHAGVWTWSSSMVDVWQERVGSTVKAETLARAVEEKHRRDVLAATDWDAWRQARPEEGQTFADCPQGYEWRKIVAIRHTVAPTVNIEVHTDNHAYVGYVVEHNSSLERMLMAQLCYVGAQVLLLNPHYTRYDIESNEDFTPFEPYLVADPMECKRYDVIEHYLKHVAKTLVPARLDRRAQSLPYGKPYFIVVDELPSIVREVKDVSEYMRVILEEGRKVGVYLISAAHNFLVNTIAPDSGGGSIRDCYRTAYYAGGDATTAKKLLNIEIKDIPENELGKGVVMLRGQAPEVKKAVLVLVPFLDNDSLYRMLGNSTYVPVAESAQFDELPPIVEQAVYQAQTRIQQPVQQQSRQVNTDDLDSGIPEQVAHQPYKPTENTYHKPATSIEQITPNRSMQLRLVKAKNLYVQGVKSSEHLAQAMGINAREGSLLLKTLRENGLIEDTRKTQAMEPFPEVPETPATPSIAPIIKDKGAKAEDIDINLACLAWNGGFNSVGKLQKAFGMTNHQAQLLRERILKQANANPEEQGN